MNWLFYLSVGIVIIYLSLKLVFHVVPGLCDNNLTQRDKIMSLITVLIWVIAWECIWAWICLTFISKLNIAG